MTSYLYRYEVKGIQSWILASERLRDLRGGSAVIEGLSKLAEARAGEDVEVLYAAAGGATLRFPNLASLERFASGWPLVLSKVAPGLQVVQGWAPEGEPQRMYDRLGEDRSRPMVELPEAGPWHARASRTGMPAVGKHEKVLEDAASRRRRRGTRGASDEELVGPERVFQEVNVLFENDLHHRCWQDAPIAVIHADGNGIGQRVMGRDPTQMRSFSDALTAASEAAARRAVALLAKAFRQTGAGPEEKLPARPVVIGGDDFTFLVRGDFGIPFLHAWLVAFEEETKRQPSLGGLTACGGIAFVRRGFPFNQAHDIAEQLCKAAKSELRGKDQSGLAFARITTSLDDKEAHSGVYTLPKLAELLADTQQAKRLPRGKLRTYVSLPYPDPPSKRQDQQKDSSSPADAMRRDQADQLWERTGEIARQTGEEAAWQHFNRIPVHRCPSRRQRIADALSWLQVAKGRPKLWEVA